MPHHRVIAPYGTVYEGTLAVRSISVRDTAACLITYSVSALWPLK